MHHDDDTTPNQPGETGDAWIESLLRRPVEPATGGADDAAAFTARVIAALPPGHGDLRLARVHSRTHRALAIALGAMLGCAAAWALGGGVLIESAQTTGELVREAAHGIQEPDTVVAYTFAGASLVAMLLLAGRGSVRRLFS